MWKSVWGKCLGCGKVGESVLGCGEVWESVWGGVGKCEGSPHTLLHLPTRSTVTQHFSLHPHNHLTRLSTLSHSHLTPFHTFSHFPTPSFTSPHTALHIHLTPSPHLPQHFPSLTPHTSSQPHTSSNTSPYSPCFIIYPIPKVLFFLIYWTG